MLGGCKRLALEVKYLDPVVDFYREQLDLDPAHRSDREVVFPVGSGGNTDGSRNENGSDLELRRPNGVPRGGLHTHFAFACPRDVYDDWYARLDETLELQEVDFGSMRSLYADDPEGNCVEIAGVDPPSGTGEPELTRIFEVVLEVEDLPTAEARYVDLGFDVVDRGSKRRRTRLSTGSFDLELWEPHLGLADARGGVHVDLGIEATDPEAAADEISDRITKRESVEEGVRIRDPDGHYVTLSDAMP
ncbi:fosmidomycin resistance protein [Halalkaliarchaeum desulfuricum]|uniref:Fosmidomycin resistance protein n=1 Tax=Halalkaliarchaeum desulfuricum TaxID=2055893 RepID=A0A343TL20_9EURY|nr:fosmidomycin resistance protein [Halalkaliarchaeum desulfuricum]AUX09792.1 fosmidomycin resistance protein [Halalkaliarchaeum desulfuricum]